MRGKTRLIASTAMAACLISGTAFAQSTPGTPAQQAGKTPPVLQNAAPNSLAAQSTAQTGVGATNNPRAVATPEANLIGEVIVTAEKREQSLQQVPVAISAFTSEKRDLLGIQSIVDQTNYTPGLTYTAGNDRLSLRGVGRLTNSHTADSGTAIYVDGGFTTSTIEAGRSPLFVERTEVLRGPQGTLYGRNAIGGAFNVISKRPSKDFGGEVRLNIGNFDHYRVDAAVSVPLNDNLRAKFAASRNIQEEGFLHNLAPCTGGNKKCTEDGVRDETYEEFQLEGEFKKLDFWFFYEKNIWNNSATPGGPTGGSNIPPNTTPGTGTFPSATYAFGGAINSIFTGPAGNPNLITSDPSAYARDTQFHNLLHGNEIYRTHLTYHFPAFDLKYIGSFQKYDYSYTDDTDGTSVASYQVPLNPTAAGFATVAPGVRFNCFQLQALRACRPATVFFGVKNTYEEDEEFYSHEFNIASTNDGPLQYLAGIYFYHEKFQYPQNGYTNQPQLAAPLTIFGTPGIANPSLEYFHTNNFSSVSSKAVFGQIDYKLLDTLKLTLGARYTQDDKKVTEEERLLAYGGSGAPVLSQYGSLAPAIDITPAAIGAATPAQLAAQGGHQQGVVSAVTFDSAGNAKRRLQDGSNAPTGTVGLEWTPDRRTLIYGKYSRGYKAFGFNTAVASAFSPFPYSLPEEMDAFEVGLKKDWTRRFQTNVTAFYDMYYNAQVPLSVQQGATPAFSIFYNVPRSVLQGVELESTWTPLDRLTILFTYAYLDSHVTKGCCVSDPNDPTATAAGAQPAGASSQGSIDSITGLPTRGQDLKGQNLPFSPHNKIAINGNYTQPLGKYGDLIGSVSYLWRDEQYSSFFNRDYNRTPSRDQIDLRVTLRDAKRRFDIIGYARNVTNNVDAEAISGTRSTTGVVYKSFSLTDPRTYGVELQYRF